MITCACGFVDAGCIPPPVHHDSFQVLATRYIDMVVVILSDLLNMADSPGTSQTMPTTAVNVVRVVHVHGNA
jgi:hypothetical protein